MMKLIKNSLWSKGLNLITAHAPKRAYLVDFVLFILYKPSFQSIFCAISLSIHKNSVDPDLLASSEAS